MAEDVEVDEKVLFADGELQGIVSDIRYGSGSTPSEVDIRMTVGGKLKSRKGINLPESDIKAPALTEKDVVDLEVGVNAGVDYVALSFVRHAKDLEIIREYLIKYGYPDMPVILKIEKPQAVDNIEEQISQELWLPEAISESKH